MKKLNSTSQKAYSKIKKICESNTSENEKSTKIRSEFYHMKNVNLSLEKNSPIFKKLVRFDINSIGENLLQSGIEIPADIKIELLIPGDLSE